MTVRKLNQSSSEEDSDKHNAQIDVRALMAEIRASVINKISDAKDSRLPFIPEKPDVNRGERKAGELLHSEELRYINQNHAYALSALRPDSIKSHRPIIGKIIVKIKRKILSFFWEGLFKGYFQAEKEFQSNLVRYLNDVAKYVDDRDAFIFWELIRKIDYDVNKAIERIERINDEQNASIITSERRVTVAVNEALSRLTHLDTDLRGLSVKIDTLDSVARGLERIINSISQRATIGASSTTASSSQDTEAPIDYSYLILENRYRGSEEVISERMSFYVPIFKDIKDPVLEIGGGRGELQLLFKQNDIPSYCVEMDKAMVEASKAKGVDVRYGDGIKHLESVADGSLGGVVAIQVIEHLTTAQLKTLVSLCLRKIKKGGKVVFETINTESMVALARNYFRDPTHVFPLHPETMRFTLDLLGLRVLDVHKLSPYSKESSLEELEVKEFMTPRWAEATEKLNRNIRRLNELLYGYQDYCIVSEVV
ncbi:MAG: methyltransferase domain-containing protein [bacterium]|nr:methyltransferase domain-containing protein [bacterium]